MVRVRVEGKVIGMASIKLEKVGETLTGSNYADVANEIMKRGMQGRFQGLSTSKLRSIYGLIMNVYTRVTGPEEFKANEADIQYLKVRMAYESGGERPVREFLDATGLFSALDGVRDYETFVLYCRYAESLVAYFKFYGGKDN